MPSTSTCTSSRSTRNGRPLPLSPTSPPTTDRSTRWPTFPADRPRRTLPQGGIGQSARRTPLPLIACDHLAIVWSSMIVDSEPVMATRTSNAAETASPAEQIGHSRAPSRPAGAGKSGVLYVILAELVACPDVVLWGVDLKGGMELRPGRPASTGSPPPPRKPRRCSPTPSPSSSPAPAGWPRTALGCGGPPSLRLR